MPPIRDYQLARLEIDERLREAIDNWRPERPRRWLAKYGNILAEGRINPLAEQYRMLRQEAEGKLSRPRPEGANGLVSHVLRIE